LEKTRVGNVITISTTKRLETERNARLLALNAQRKIAPLETAYVKINYVKATDIVSMLSREIEQQASSGGIGGVGGTGGQAQQGGGAGGRNQQVAIMSPRGTVAADATTNVVIVRDVADRIAAVRELITKIDVQTPQVVIESYIITTNENLNRDLGIQWGYQYTASTLTGNPTGLNFPGTIGVGGVSGLLNSGTGGVPFMVDFPSSAAAGSGSVLDLALGSLAGTQALNLRLSALENQGKARVIARPRVVTLNNKVAEIKSRRIVRVPVVSGRTSIVTGAGGGGDSGNAFQEFDVGITLKITPQISSDGFVLLEIAAESSELTDPSVRVGGSGNAFPVIPDSLSRTTSSSVLIRANDTFVLGGIFQDSMRQTERGIPYLRDTPGLGWLFRGNLRNKNKDELMVFITPKLVAGSGTTGYPTAQQLWENRPREAAPAASTSSVTLGR
jgi:type IV pilus assembly protein PilQ